VNVVHAYELVSEAVGHSGAIYNAALAEIEAALPALNTLPSNIVFGQCAPGRQDEFLRRARRGLGIEREPTRAERAELEAARERASDAEKKANEAATSEVNSRSESHWNFAGRNAHERATSANSAAQQKAATAREALAALERDIAARCRTTPKL
jgi:hypothetical protein